MRFQKRIKILPGIKLNLSKSGISASIGKPGATVNIGAKGTKVTGGIPGTGLSHTEYLTKKASQQTTTASRPSEEEGPGAHHTALGVVILVCIFVGLAWLLSKA